MVRRHGDPHGNHGDGRLYGDPIRSLFGYLASSLPTNGQHPAAIHLEGDRVGK